MFCKHQQETYVPILAIFGTFSRNHQKFTQNDGITSILLIVTEHFSTKPIKNNLIQLQLLSKIIFNGHSAVKQR